MTDLAHSSDSRSSSSTSLSTQLATSPFPTHRIIGLGDGVFAIALTPLVLELRVPAATALPGATMNCFGPSRAWPPVCCGTS